MSDVSREIISDTFQDVINPLFQEILFDELAKEKPSTFDEAYNVFNENFESVVGELDNILRIEGNLFIEEYAKDHNIEIEEE